MKKTSKNIAIGGLVSIACGLFIWMLLFLHPTFGDGKFRLRVRFPSVDKIAVGTRVTFAGRPVGEVSAMNLVTEARLSDSDQIFAYELTLSLDSALEIYENDSISVKTQGLMGERTIAIMPRRITNKDAKPLTSNDLILASSGGSVEEDFATLVNKVEKGLDNIGNMQLDLSKSARALGTTCEHITAILQSAQDGDLVGKTERLAANLEVITGALADQKGSLGKLLYNDEFYNKSLASLDGANMLLNDLNKYGLLYHWNSDWKREHTKRQEQLAKFKTPKEFRRYLNEELTKVYVIMGRIEAGYAKAGSTLRDKEDLAKVYNELQAEMKILSQRLEAEKSEQESKQIANNTLN